ncbi:hypothetical protein HYX09_00020 [Candidatus Woesearchaeota archaeon]|nr:hypothetical protein [Candidatus Woesearchaeota archaeon]
MPFVKPICPETSKGVEGATVDGVNTSDMEIFSRAKEFCEKRNKSSNK